MKRFILIFLAVLLCSCSNKITRNSIRYEYMTATIFQTLDSGTALALDDKFNVVQFITNDEIYYDGLIIKGTFRLVDTYAYETVQGKIKVVPVYVRLSEYRRYLNKLKN